MTAFPPEPEDVGADPTAQAKMALRVARGLVKLLDGKTPDDLMSEGYDLNELADDAENLAKWVLWYAVTRARDGDNAGVDGEPNWQKALRSLEEGS